MGNTTIISLNHDIAQEIEDHPIAFAEMIASHLKSGSWKDFPIKIPGGEIVCTFHRSPGEHNDAWYKFLKKIRK